MTELDRLWAGWRSAYVSEASAGAHVAGERRDHTSVFAGILAAIERGELTDEDAKIVHRGAHAFVILNAFPYGSGHLLVMPYREVAELEALTADESSELWALVNDAVVAVKAAYDPGGVNVGFNLGRASGAGVPTHLHCHVLPRWDADTNFMTSIAEARVMPETLSTTWAKLTEAWPRPR